MKSDAQGAHVTFDPVGLFIEPGTTVRWDANVHTTTAYHPKNRNRSLRIPIAAQPWDSGYLLPKQGFAVTLTVERVYDYFCIPHEHAGIGEATGPGAEPFDYFKGMPQGANWLTVPMPAQELSFDREHLERKGRPSSDQPELTTRDRFRRLGLGE